MNGFGIHMIEDENDVVEECILFSLNQFLAFLFINKRRFILSLSECLAIKSKRSVARISPDEIFKHRTNTRNYRAKKGRKMKKCFSRSIKFKWIWNSWWQFRTVKKNTYWFHMDSVRNQSVWYPPRSEPSCIPASCQRDFLALFERAPFLKHDKTTRFSVLFVFTGSVFLFFFFVFVLGVFKTC